MAASASTTSAFTRWFDRAWTLFVLWIAFGAIAGGALILTQSPDNHCGGVCTPCRVHWEMGGFLAYAPCSRGLQLAGTIVAAWNTFAFACWLWFVSIPIAVLDLASLWGKRVRSALDVWDKARVIAWVPILVLPIAFLAYIGIRSLL